MTSSSHKKMIKQLKNKPAIMLKFNKYNVPKKRTCGFNINKCRRCGRTGGHISSYGLHICRQCFREKALELGFKKYS